jgi:hypothetical protein
MRHKWLAEWSLFLRVCRQKRLVNSAVASNLSYVLMFLIVGTDDAIWWLNCWHFFYFKSDFQMTNRKRSENVK